MALSTDQFPQADKLGQVGQVAIAVSKGRTSDEAIEKYIGLDSGNRQGRYYRKAAEIVGLITTSGNKSALTKKGQAFVQLSTDGERTEFLARCLTEAPVFREVTRFITQQKPRANELADYVVSIYPGSASTALRRVSTIEAFVIDSGLAKVEGGRYVPNQAAAASIVIEEPLDAGLDGKPVEVDVETNEVLTQKQTIQIEVDLAKVERANLTHHKLVNATAAFLARKQIQPLQNPLVDVFARDENGETILYEMKSVSESNFARQIRRAISQLLEYRYVFRIPMARLCIVTNARPPQAMSWYIDYLERGLGIAFLWTNDFTTLSCEDKSRELLGPFSV